MAGAFLVSNPYTSLGQGVYLEAVGGNANGGGLFSVSAAPSGPVLFDTFCVSIVTTFNPGQTYYPVISSTIAANTPPDAPTYVTYGTAYMYSQFLHGNATYGANLNATTLDDVQATIWYLQGLLVSSGGFYGSGGTSRWLL